MGLLHRLRPQTITSQITCLVIVAVLLGVGLASAVLYYPIYTNQTSANAESFATIRAAHIAAIVREAENAKPEDLAMIVRRGRGHSLDVRIAPAASPSDPLPGSQNSSVFTKAIGVALKNDWGIDQTLSGEMILVKVNQDTTLAFRVLPRNSLHNFVFVQTTWALAIIVFIVLFLSVYAVRWITSPLSSIAAAARSFGQPGAAHQTFKGGAPREIVQVSEALNDMRDRVQVLVDERTQMLVAISHDLRTPLTRLRLRAERLHDGEMKDGMLRDITVINSMLSESLTYLRDGGRSEPAQLVDLPSLLQTICAQFSDVGHDVTYKGPNRLAFSCRAQALGRAVTNVVDNGVKYGSAVMIELESAADHLVQISVSDDGPGIPDRLRNRVFEPFFRGDSARSPQGRPGFGLGLSIARDIVRRHSGDIELTERSPQGLMVRLSIRELSGLSMVSSR